MLPSKSSHSHRIHNNLLNLHKTATTNSVADNQTDVRLTDQKEFTDPTVNQTAGYWNDYYETKWKNVTIRISAPNVEKATSYIFNTLMKHSGWDRKTNRNNKLSFNVRRLHDGKKTNVIGIRERNHNKRIPYPFYNKLMYQ